MIEMIVKKVKEIRKCLKFGNQKINLHEYDNLIKPGARVPKPGERKTDFKIYRIKSPDIKIKHLCSGVSYPSSSVL